MSYLEGQPVLVLREGATRSRNRDAQRSNIMAARIIGEVVKSTLGPRGMDKMLVDTMGDITVSSDGATILDEIDVQNPAAKMIVEVAKAQDDEVGDGTTTAVILASELLGRAEELLEDGVHPTIIVSGFKKASDKALVELNQCSKPVDLKERATLKKVAITAMSGKGIGDVREHLAEIAIDAVKQIMEKRGGSDFADADNISIVKRAGKTLRDSQLINGIILDKEVVHQRMPKRVSNAKIALIDCELDVEKTEFSAEIRIKDPSQMKAFKDEESKIMQRMVEKIKVAGANVVLSQKGIDEIVQYFLAREGLLAVQRVKKSDVEKLARATGAKIVSNLDDLTSGELGSAGLVEERKLGEEKMVFVEGCKNPRSVSILLQGSINKLVDEAERAVDDTLSAIVALVDKNKIVFGGGAIEAELAKRLRSYATKVGGREQLAIEVFAESLETIPKTLAENAGLDSIDAMVALRTSHQKKTGLDAGIDPYSGKVKAMSKLGVLEPTKIKEQAIKSATEAASMILRIDDVVAAAKPPPAPPQGPEGEPPY